MTALSPIDLIKQATQADKRFAAAIVFGSQALGTARPDSDIDLAELMHDPAILAESFLNILCILCVKAQRDVHLVDLEDTSLDLQRAIFTHGLILFDRSEGQLDHIRKQSAINYVDAEYHRRIIDKGLRLRKDKSD